jgi:bifunctional DNA-binding transcriptional regulator/antitoxin component of YhaV-PrlF toxin-antitoxin module
MSKSSKPPARRTKTTPSGFAEETQTRFVTMPHVRKGHQVALSGRLKIGPGGRVLIPANMRAALGAADGDTLLATLDDGELRLVSVATAVKRTQAMIRLQLKTVDGSAVDELIAERRAEQARDAS